MPSPSVAARQKRIMQVARTATPNVAPRRAARPAKTDAKSPVPRAGRTAATTRSTRDQDRGASFVSKDALRAQLEKTEQQVATLRKKNRELSRAAREAAARIAELEEELADLQKQAARQAGRASASDAPRPRRQRRSRAERDPGDAVPEGVAAAEPLPMDREAEQALENLERHLPD